MVVYSGRTVEQAIEKGLRDLNLPRMKAHIKVISREKKGFLGFGKKPAQVSVEPIIEEIAHKADRDVIKVAPDAVKQPDDFVTSSKEETTAFKKVTKLITVSDNKGEAQEILKQPVATETFGEEVPGKIQEQPKATIIPLSVKHESSEEDATEPKVTSLAPKLEPVAQLQNVETSESEDDFSSFVASEFSSDESSESNLEEVQAAQLPLNNKEALLKDPIFLYHIGRNLAMALHRQGITASTNASYFVKERLATHILNIEEQDIFQLSPSILSSSFGTSYRHVQRVIKQFIDQGIIEKKAFKTYRILQRDSLETLAFID